VNLLGVMRWALRPSLTIAVASILTLATVSASVVGTEVSAPAASPATTANPPRVVVLGDSTAMTLSYALAATAPPGTTVDDGGNFGCGLAMGTFSSNHPPQPGLAMFPACNQATPPSGQWPARDANFVSGTGPGDIVLYVAGDWEVDDILMSGHWTNILSPSFQRYEMGQMRKAVKIGTARGAHFEFFTMPAEDDAEQLGKPLDASPGDSPKRRTIYNRLLRRVASEFPGNVSVVDYGSILSPKGVFTDTIDGVQVRTPDGVHTPAYAPGNPFSGNSTESVAQAFYHWLSPRIWPQIVNSASRVGRSTPTTGG
jgi:hypothetical protein